MRGIFELQIGISKRAFGVAAGPENNGLWFGNLPRAKRTFPRRYELAILSPKNWPASNRGGCGMEALLNNLWATIAAGVVLTVIMVLVAHAIAS